MCSSKKSISSNQLSRVLEITYKSAWFLSHRIREAMRSTDKTPMGGEGMTVEVDETYIGRIAGYPKLKGGAAHKNTVVTLVERGGRAKSFHIASATANAVGWVVHMNIKHEFDLMTDTARMYPEIGTNFASHEMVNHSEKEYVRGDAHTNTIEGFFSIFKRGMKGVYQHCAEHHLHRYLAEYDFRYSNQIKLGVDDNMRAEIALLNVKCKRLTYRQPSGIETASLS